MKSLEPTTRHLLGGTLLLALVIGLACSGNDPSDSIDTAAAPAATATTPDQTSAQSPDRAPDQTQPGRADRPDSGPATPVRTAAVERSSLERLVSAPGEVQALAQQRVRAPFAGVVTALDVVAGDRVRRGQTVGGLVSRDAEAAVTGAQEMLRAAETPQERDDAERALELARAHLVTSPLTTSVAGIVTDRSAASGDRVAEGQELLTVVDESSLVFRALVAQSDLGGIRPGERAEIELSGAADPLPGTVHGILPGIDAASLTAPVRIDLDRRPRELAPGLFGTAKIVVGEDRDVLVVPEAALLRDDVQGTVRVGLVRPDGTLHWVEVTVGLAAGSRVEVTPISGPLSAGDLVATAGHLGLPDGAPVRSTGTTRSTDATKPARETP